MGRLQPPLRPLFDVIVTDEVLSQKMAGDCWDEGRKFTCSTCVHEEEEEEAKRRTNF